MLELIYDENGIAIPDHLLTGMAIELLNSNKITFRYSNLIFVNFVRREMLRDKINPEDVTFKFNGKEYHVDNNYDLDWTSIGLFFEEQCLVDIFKFQKMIRDERNIYTTDRS